MPCRLGAAGPLALALSSIAAFSQPSATISARDRVVIASTVYHHIKTYFPDLAEMGFDEDYKAYVTELLAAPSDRRTFDLATMALVATLHDSHSWFFDRWFDENYGQSSGLTVYRWDTTWVVIHSRIATVSPGDVITAVDGTPTETFFQTNRKYLSGSSERDAATGLFDTPVLFPERFAITLSDRRQVTIDRAHDTKAEPPPTTDGRWLVPNTVGYVRMGAFGVLDAVANAWRLITQFHDANAIILDLRGNVGGGDPIPLQAALMAKPYRTWSEQAATSGGALLRGYGVSHPGLEHIHVSEAGITPHGPTYTGRLIILVDRGCSCSCEDFTMPFKVTGRARFVGEATAGTFSFTDFTEFANGMQLNIAAIRHTFPDGSRFEGIGIVPDVPVQPTPGDLKAGRDVVLDRALVEATR
jgi:carboxyl-terminal processing protease